MVENILWGGMGWYFNFVSLNIILVVNSYDFKEIPHQYEQNTLSFLDTVICILFNNSIKLLLLCSLDTLPCFAIAKAEITRQQ
jgi:hypothetical protein